MLNLQTQISNSDSLSLGSVSEISGYSSGYESEAGLSECPSVGSPVPVSEADREEDEANRDGSDRDGALQQRRLRTKFTPEQITKLEKIFQKHKYLDAGERLKSAQKLNLSETQVTIRSTQRALLLLSMSSILNGICFTH